MKIKQGADVRGEDCDFWYDLTNGGYIDPEKLLVDPKDAKRVKDAIAVVKEFEQAYYDAAENDES